MALEKGLEHLKKFGLEERVMLFPVSSATVAEAALAIGCEEAHIAKTMSFLVGETPILIVTAGDTKIDNSKFKAVFHVKAKMIPAEEVESRIGHAVGGVCPFGINEGVKVYLDESLKRFDTVYPACGTDASGVRLTVPELELSSGSQGWIDVCRLR